MLLFITIALLFNLAARFVKERKSVAGGNNLPLEGYLYFILCTI